VKEKVSVKDEKECSFCKLCEEACKLDAISVQMDEKTFIFSFESDGSLSPEEIILQAIDVIKDKVKEFKKKIG
jgi:DNA-directed RNA polymerase subunit D